MFENLELQLLAEFASLHGLCDGMSPARMNLMFWSMANLSSVAVTGVDIYCTSQSQILAYVLNIWPKYAFSLYIVIWTSKKSAKSAMFVLTNWGKKHYNKLHYQRWSID